jgi:hypothetical protein
MIFACTRIHFGVFFQKNAQNLQKWHKQKEEMIIVQSRYLAQ